MKVSFQVPKLLVCTFGLLQLTAYSFFCGVLLTLRFRFGRDGMHSGEQAVGCGPPLFTVPDGKKSLQVASVVLIFVPISHLVQKEVCVWWYPFVSRFEVPRS